MNRDLTIKQAAELIGVHENTIRIWINAGTLNAYRLNGTKIIRIAEADIHALKQPVRNVSNEENK